MNRIVLSGLTTFFALIGICLIGSPKEAKAFHGWQFYGCCGCQGWHPWHANQRCYSCSGCSGCYASGGHCCASSCSCYQRCYGCHSGCGCQGVIYHSCYGCYGGCSGCAGYYSPVIPTIAVPVEPAPAVSPPVNSSGEKITLRIYPVTSGTFSDSSGNDTVVIGDASTEVTSFDPYIHEPR